MDKARIAAGATPNVLDVASGLHRLQATRARTAAGGETSGTSALLHPASKLVVARGHRASRQDSSAGSPPRDEPPTHRAEPAERPDGDGRQGGYERGDHGGLADGRFLRAIWRHQKGSIEVFERDGGPIQELLRPELDKTPRKLVRQGKALEDIGRV